ncbi:MAG: type II secretion system protein GspE, partial [Acidobacteria bacterium]
MSLKLGEILVRENLITPQQLHEAIEYQRSNGGRLGSSLVKLGFVSDEVITDILSKQYGVPSINLEIYQIEEDVIKLIPREMALKYTILPVSRTGATLTLAMADPTNVFALDDVKFHTGLNIEPVIASETSIQEAIAKYYSLPKSIELADTLSKEMEFKPTRVASGNGLAVSTETKLKTEDLTVSLSEFEFKENIISNDLEILEEGEEIDVNELIHASEEAPIIRLVNLLFVEALKKGASDIHIEPYEKNLRIRF